MAAADAVFSAADVNQDQRLDLNEFRNLAAGGLGGAGLAGGAGYSSSAYSSGGDLGLGLAGAGGAGGYSSYSESSYSSGGGAGLDAGLVGLNAGGYGGGLVGGASYGVDVGGVSGLGLGGGSSYQESSYSSQSVGGGGDLGGVNIAALQAGNFAGISGLTQETSLQRYATDSQGLFQDSNPTIIRRPAPQGPATYTQNIRVRFLQPPPIPPPGPLIIREIRPPQPPAPPPLRIRQQAPPLPTPAPLVLRERPPVAPLPVASQTVIRRLAALPVPPRSVIIERLPANPARPRDIIIERWVPYGRQAQRRTIVQRAGAAQQYVAPRNVIIQYEAPQVRIVRQFQRLGVAPESPSAYVSRYGGTLRESVQLVQEARAAGVVEDISPPLVAGLVGGLSESSYASSSYGAGADLGLAGAGLIAGGAYDAGLGGASYSSSSSYESVGGGLGGVGLAGGAGYGLAGGAGYGLAQGGGYGAAGLGLSGAGSSYQEESSSYSSTGGAGLAGGYGIGGVGLGSNFDSADLNRDGVLTRGEFAAAGLGI